MVSIIHRMVLIPLPARKQRRPVTQVRFYKDLGEGSCQKMNPLEDTPYQKYLEYNLEY